MCIKGIINNHPDEDEDHMKEVDRAHDFEDWIQRK